MYFSRTPLWPRGYLKVSCFIFKFTWRLSWYLLVIDFQCNSIVVRDIIHMTSIRLNLFICFVTQDVVCLGASWWIFHKYLGRMCIFFSWCWWGGGEFSIHINEVKLFLLLFVSSSSLRILSLLSLLVTERAVLKSPAIIVDHFLLSVLFLLHIFNCSVVRFIYT